MLASGQFPPTDSAAVEEQLSRPTRRAVATLQSIPGDILLLGAGGKMGPTLARMARRAADAAGSQRRIVAVSRFTCARAWQQLHDAGVETLRGDLLDSSFLRSLPESENVVLMTGFKFGTAEAAGATWATNAYLPGAIMDRYPDSRIVAFSTGNVYGLTTPASGGSRETDPLQPIGEYAMSAVGRERVIDYFSRARHTPTAVLRLNYAVEFRYGVLVDLAQKIYREEPIPLAMGYFNCIWQRDACAMALASIAHAGSPPRVFNLTGPEILSTRQISERLATLMSRPVQFIGEEAPTALLSNASSSIDLLGPVETSLDEALEWTAAWISRDGPTLDRPTHFEVRDGKF